VPARLARFHVMMSVTIRARGGAVISNKTRDKIAQLSAKSITHQLRATAYEQLVENFCLPRCGKTPDGELCPEAKRTHQRFLSLLFNAYSKFN